MSTPRRHATMDMKATGWLWLLNNHSAGTTDRYDRSEQTKPCRKAAERIPQWLGRSPTVMHSAPSRGRRCPCHGVFTWYGQPTTQETYPRTATPSCLAALATSSNLRRLSSMLELMFLRLKASLAAVKIATSLAPALTAFSKPCRSPPPPGKPGYQQAHRGTHPTECQESPFWEASGTCQAGRPRNTIQVWCSKCSWDARLHLSSTAGTTCLHVGREDRVADARPFGHAAQDLCCISQLRHPLGAHKASGLHNGQPSIGQALN